MSITSEFQKTEPNKLTTTSIWYKLLKVGLWVDRCRSAGILLLQWQGENFAYRKNLKFPTFNLYTVPAKILYLQSYPTDFRKHCFSTNILNVGMWVENFSCAGILFLWWQGENFAHRKHLKFPTFNLYTVQAKILYVQRYSTDFRKLCFRSKFLNVGISVESFRCAGILLLQWRVENFAHQQHLKYSHFQPVHCSSKNPISPKVFHRNSKTLPQLEVLEGGHIGGKFQVRRYFTFAMTRWKIAHRQHLKFPTFNLYTVPAKILFLQRYSIEFRKLSFSSKTLTVGIWVEIFRCAGILPLRWQRENFAQRKHLKFPTFNWYTVPAKPYISKVTHRFSKTFLQLKDVEGGHLCGNFQVRRYFTFAMARWKLCTSKTLQISHFQPVHCTS